MEKIFNFRRIAFSQKYTISMWNSKGNFWKPQSVIVFGLKNKTIPKAQKIGHFQVFCKKTWNFF